MIKFLIKSTNEVRVSTKEEADELHKELEQEAQDNGYTLAAWSETHKDRKSKGEIIEEWMICKWTFVFNDAKEPVDAYNKISYDFYKVGEQF
jgi:hypothetical protein